MRTRAARLAVFVSWTALVAASACKLEPVYDLVPGKDPVATPAPGPTIPEAVPIEEDRSQIRAEIARQLTALSGPALGGRRPGSEGGSATVEWLETSMRKIGLIPDGVGGGWQQPVVVRLDVTVASDIELPRVMEDEPPDVLTQGDQVLLWRAADRGRWGAELQIIEAGHGVSAPNLGHDDYAMLDAEGKVVLVEAGLPAALEDLDDPPEPYETMEYKFAQAKLAGAAGCLITSEALRDETRWRALRRRFAKREPGETQDPAVLASAGLDVAGVVSAGAEASLRTWMAATSLREATGAPPTLARFTIESEAQTVVAANVVGRVPGDEHPEQVVVVLAHWDAGGTSEALADGGGLIDNASGVAVMLGVARLVVERLARGDAPARSIVFAATASDTLGLAGARALVSSGPLSSARLIALISLDDLVARDDASNLFSVDATTAGLADLLAQASATIEPLARDAAPHAELGHQPALEISVPAITLTRHEASSSATVTRAQGPAESPVGDAALTTLVDDAVATFELVWRLSTGAATPSTRPDNDHSEQPEPKSEPEPEPKSEPKPEPKSEPEPEPKPKPKSEPKPKPKPKPTPESESEPEPTPEPRPSPG